MLFTHSICSCSRMKRMKSTYFLLWKKRFGLEECEWAGVIEYFHRWSVSVGTHTHMWIGVHLTTEGCSKHEAFIPKRGSEGRQQAYLFGNQTAVHLIVRASDVCNTGHGGAGYVKGEGKLFLCNQGRHFHTRILSYNNTSSVLSTLALLRRRLTLRRVSICCRRAKSWLSSVCRCYMLSHCMSYTFVPTCHFWHIENCREISQY